MAGLHDVVDVDYLSWDEAVLKSKLLVLVEFWHPACSHCRAIEPVYAELAAAYAGRLVFARLNVTENAENGELARKYGVMGTPTFIFFCGGRPVFDVVGALLREHLEQAVEFALQRHRECSARSTPLTLSYIR